MAKNEFQKGILSLIILVGVAPAQDAASLVRDGTAKAKRNEFRVAIAPLSEALSMEPKNFEALRWRGHCRNALGMHEKAIEDYNAALRIDPKSAWVWYARGMARHHLGQTKHAIEDYTKSIELNPSNHKAVEWRGFNRSLRGDYLGAYLDFTRAMKLDPENSWVFHARGRAATSLLAFDKAKDDFESALLLNAKSAESHAQLGFIYVAEGDKKKALASLERAFDLDPKRLDYVRLWRYWLRGTLGKLGENARDELPRAKWAGNLAKILLGELTRAQLLGRLSGYNVTPEELPVRRCEAEFYLGLRSLLVNKPNRAREFFKEALTFGNASQPEWRAAHRLSRR
jgi:tetratricopeptide (TPR) repeat protein